MRVLYFSRTFTTHDHRFLTALTFCPHEIWFLRVEDEPFAYHSLPVPKGIHTLPPLGNGAAVRSPTDWIEMAPCLEAVLNRVKPHLVHAGPVQKCALVAALCDFRPLATMSWGSDLLVDATRDEFWSWMTRYTLQRTDLLFSDCAEVSRAAKKFSRLRQDQIVEFPWGIDLDVFAPGPDRHQFRNLPGWSSATIVIATRSWEPAYGTMHLLEGFRSAVRRNGSLRLLLIGSGSQAEEIRKFISDHQMGKLIQIVGGVEPSDLPDYFRAADIYASCSLNDGSSISLLEAMATGLPALVTARPSNREWIAGPDQGMTAPFGDTGAISAGLVALAEMSRDERRLLGKRNLAVAQNRANWKENSRRLIAAYDSLRPVGSP